MSSLTISIFQNKIFFEIIKEMKLFSKFKIKHYEDIGICKKNAELKNELVVFFGYLSSEIKEVNFPFIMVDNNDTKLPNKIDNINILQMDDQECINLGYKNASATLKKKSSYVG